MRSQAVADAEAVALLRSFVGGVDPVLSALRTDPEQAITGLDGDKATPSPKDWRARAAAKVNSVKAAKVADWGALSADDRAAWWISRVGSLLAGMSAVPVMGGPLLARIPVKEAVSAAGQGIVLCGIADAFEVQNVDTRVALLAHVLLARDLDPRLFPAATDTADLRAQVADDLPSSRPAMTDVYRAAWRLGATLVPVLREYGSGRRQGDRKAGLARRVPGLGDFLGEREAIAASGQAGIFWLKGNVSGLSS